jgi:hypothetical protein
VHQRLGARRAMRGIENEVVDQVRHECLSRARPGPLHNTQV